MEKNNCLRCNFRHTDNWNCTAVGGFCTAVPAAHCQMLREYLDTGLTPEQFTAADVAPVVRCKDCEYSNKALYGWLWYTAGPCGGKAVLEDCYCKCGEMRADNENR